jgi:hypothetical protein
MSAGQREGDRYKGAVRRYHSFASSISSSACAANVVAFRDPLAGRSGCRTGEATAILHSFWSEDTDERALRTA